MNSGRKPSIFLEAWGESKSILDWSKDARVSLSKQNIMRRYRDFLADIEEEREPPRYKSVEDLLTRPLVPSSERNRRGDGKRKVRVTDWDRQVWGPLCALCLMMGRLDNGDIQQA
jgi:hypothetical protein